MPEPRFYTHDLNDQNLFDLRNEVTALNRNEGRLVGIVDEQDGGIIAYAIGEDHAAAIVTALRGREAMTEAFARVAAPLTDDPAPDTTSCPSCEALRPDLAPGSVCEHCGHVEPDDEESDPEMDPTAIGSPAWQNAQAALIQAEEDEAEPCECEPGATVAGVHWPTATDGDGSHPWVERCDMCKRYPDDESAAEAVAAAVGGKVEWATVSGGRSPYVVDPRIASDYAIAHSTAESARIEAEDRGVDKL